MWFTGNQTAETDLHIGGLGLMLSRTISEECGLQDQSKGEVVSIVSTEASASSAESSGTSMALQHCPKLRQGAGSLYPHINPSLDTGCTQGKEVLLG